MSAYIELLYNSLTSSLILSPVKDYMLHVMLAFGTFSQGAILLFSVTGFCIASGINYLIGYGAAYVTRARILTPPTLVKVDRSANYFNKIVFFIMLATGYSIFEPLLILAGFLRSDVKKVALGVFIAEVAAHVTLIAMK